MNATIKYEGRDVTFYDVDETSHIGNCLLNVCWYEEKNLRIIHDLKVEGTYVDVGAHWGTHCIYFALFCPSDRVYAFEPHPSYFSTLLKNLDENKIIKVRAFKTALVEAPGIKLPANEGWNYDTEPLDSFGLSDVKILKIDVEGMELRVLQGAKKTLKTVEHVFLEVWPEATCKERGLEYPMQAITGFLASYGLKYKQAMPWEDLHWWSK